MKDEDVDQRHAAAYHEAGQAVMAFYLGGWVNDEGVEIDERRYCGLCFPLKRAVLHHGLTSFGPRDHRWLPLGLIRLGLPETNCFLNAFTVHALTYLSS